MDKIGTLFNGTGFLSVRNVPASGGWEPGEVGLGVWVLYHLLSFRVDRRLSWDIIKTMTLTLEGCLCRHSQRDRSMCWGAGLLLSQGLGN